MPLLDLFFPVKAALHVGPRNLQHRKWRPPVEPDGPPKEGPVPTEIRLPEHDLVTVDNVRIENPGKSVDAWAYQSLQECKDKNEVPDDACEKAEKAALVDQEKTPKYDNQATCEDIYGPGQCVPRSQAGGHGSFAGHHGGR